MSDPASTERPFRISGKVFVLVLVPVLVLAFAWLIYARWEFRAAVPTPPTSMAP